jgi:hypothetical protein
MRLLGNVTGDGWSVTAETFAAATASYGCEVHVRHDGSDGDFKHSFRHWKTFSTEREAVLDGLHEGLVWIDLKQSGTIRL